MIAMIPLRNRFTLSLAKYKQYEGLTPTALLVCYSFSMCAMLSAEQYFVSKT